jgi:hypothetical protein
MMKQHVLRLLLIPALLCALFGVAYLSTAETAHAASVQPHTVTPLISRVTCSFTKSEPLISTDYGNDPVCFVGSGGENVTLYNVYSIYSGAATISFSWIGCDGSAHSSRIGSYYYTLTAQKAPNGFAGCKYISRITYISLGS